MNNNDIPVWEKYTLTIEEASKYFRIGENKLRRLAEENKDAGWLIMNGNRIQIKRRQFEKIIDKLVGETRSKNLFPCSSVTQYFLSSDQPLSISCLVINSCCGIAFHPFKELFALQKLFLVKLYFLLYRK